MHRYRAVTIPIEAREKMMLRKACAVDFLASSRCERRRANDHDPTSQGPVDPSAGPIRVQISVILRAGRPMKASIHRAARPRQPHIYALRRANASSGARSLPTIAGGDVNVNINRQQQQFGGQQVEGFQVGGTLGYRITQKPRQP